MEDQKVAPLDDVAPTTAAPTKTDLPVITDPAAYAEGEAASGGGPGEPGPAADDDRAGIARLGDPVAVWPCAGCGRPVPQPVRGARTVRYCQDGGGACERAAREARERGLESPGLTGQVAWAWEMVDRLEGVADRLAGSLMSELSVAGVERRVADARADAAGHIAIAQRERDASQRQAELAWRETATARARAEAAEQEAASARATAERLAAERDAARQESADAKDEAEAAKAARLAAERERDRVASREGELLASLESARSELVALHGRVSQAETLVEGQRVEAAAAERTAEDLRSAVRDAEAKRGQAVADRDQIQARASELEQRNWQLARAADELHAAVRALTAERDAARAEADRARRRVDALTALTDRHDTGPRPVADREPPTGLHVLPPMNGMPGGSLLDGGDPLATDPRLGPLSRNGYPDRNGHPDRNAHPDRNGHRLPHAG
ncbi:chromosome segregation ATPase [Actinomadura bangladeshensis]|uniref:Chromosome segregation ATPase n=1 Tax=Actinomadura bangladeshensis TaxID=453573 RepID=A0A4R4NTK7_9ACTN|nr:chromosome segregation ATPase [Actinomadura bangladeshensis]TDC13061.1 chromosome segregation ATPase [Actinomadura bangladeshensis]